MAAHSRSSLVLRGFILWICALLQATAAELCSYITDDYNIFDRRLERMVSFKKCQWGCCWKYEDPCCSTPVGLIVGCVIGGAICLSLVVLAVCCCCCYQRRRTPGVIVRYGDSGVVFNNATPANQTASLPPGVYAPPPSYEEVMSGQYNSAFKPDTVQ